MPLLALSAKARLMVPVGAMESRCELRSPWSRTRSFRAAGRREAKVGSPRYRSALNSGKGPRSRASSTEASYAVLRISSAMCCAMLRASGVS